MKRAGSVQTVFLGVEAVEDGVVRQAGGPYLAVLAVGSVNFALQGEVEQEATIAGFAAFLNGLSFPVQILVRALPVDVEGYLGRLERRALQLPAGLADLARDHAAFLGRLARTRTLLERHFYLVVPVQADAAGARRRWPIGRKVTGVSEDAARKLLTFRCEEVERQLGRCGLAARRLGSAELVQLLYGCWCPDLSRLQRLRRDLADYTALVVHGERPAERRL